MRNIWLVAEHEFMTNIRKRSFLFAVFGVPILMAVIFGITIAVQIQAEEGGIIAERIGYVEQFEVIELESETFTAYESVSVATQALDNNEVDVFFVITPLYISTGEVRLYSYGSVSDETRDAIETYLAENLSQNIVSDAPSELLLDPIDFTMYMENTQSELSFEGVIGLLLTPVIFAVVLLMALQLSSTFLMSGVVEEKSNHIMEILITSITPYQLLAGKMLGLGALGLIQMLVWLILGAIGIRFSGNFAILSGVVMPLDFILLILLYFVLTYFLYSSLLAGIGAVMGSEQESRTYAGIVSMLIAIPFFFFSVLIFNPDSPIFTFLLFFPFTAGMTYMLKYPFTTIPTWQLFASVSLLAASTFIVTWAAARVFRWALLLYGKKPNIKTLWQVISGRREVGVFLTDAAESEKSA